MDSKGKYPTEHKEPESELPKTADEVQTQKEKRRFEMPKISGEQLGAICSTLAIMALGMFIMHSLYPVVHPVTYGKAKEFFASKNKAFQGDLMEEKNRVCTDAAGTPLACYALHEHPFVPQISQVKVPGE